MVCALPTLACVCVRTVRTQFEDAAKQAADELTQPRPLGEEKMEEIQVMLKSDANPMQIRQLEV